MRKAVTMLDNEGNKCYPRTTIENVYGLVGQLMRIDNIVKMITEGSTTDLTEVIDARVVGGKIYETLGQALNSLDRRIKGDTIDEIDVHAVTWSEFIPTLGMERLTVIGKRLNEDDTELGDIKYALYDVNKNIIKESYIEINETISINNVSYIKLWIGYVTETVFRLKYRMNMAEFSDCVPCDRKVAGLLMNKDITADDLGKAILTADVNYEF